MAEQEKKSFINKMFSVPNKSVQDSIDQEIAKYAEDSEYYKNYQEQIVQDFYDKISSEEYTNDLGEERSKEEVAQLAVNFARNEKFDFKSCDLENNNYYAAHSESTLADLNIYPKGYDKKSKQYVFEIDKKTAKEESLIENSVKDGSLLQIHNENDLKRYTQNAILMQHEKCLDKSLNKKELSEVRTNSQVPGMEFFNAIRNAFRSFRNAKKHAEIVVLNAFLEHDRKRLEQLSKLVNNNLTNNNVKSHARTLISDQEELDTGLNAKATDVSKTVEVSHELPKQNNDIIVIQSFEDNLIPAEKLKTEKETLSDGLHSYTIDKKTFEELKEAGLFNSKGKIFNICKPNAVDISEGLKTIRTEKYMEKPKSQAKEVTQTNTVKTGR